MKIYSTRPRPSREMCMPKNVKMFLLAVMYGYFTKMEISNFCIYLHDHKDMHIQPTMEQVLYLMKRYFFFER